MTEVKINPNKQEKPKENTYASCIPKGQFFYAKFGGKRCLFYKHFHGVSSIPYEHDWSFAGDVHFLEYEPVTSMTILTTPE